MASDNNEQFWVDDPSELYKNFLVVIPTKNMTRNQQLNAISRLVIYILILLIFCSNTAMLIIIGIVVLLFITLAHKLFYYNTVVQTIIKPETALTTAETEGFTNLEKVQSGYYDSDNNLILGYRQNPYLKLPNNNDAYNVYDLIDCDKNMCRRPTPNNPFMNPSLFEFGTENPPAACNVDDEEIKDSMKVNYDHMLFRDVADVWERKNAERQFFTLPNTAIPNNQTEFAKWLYWIPAFDNCKESGSACLRQDTLRTVNSRTRGYKH
jgi:hypothetical protein